MIESCCEIEHEEMDDIFGIDIDIFSYELPICKGVKERINAEAEIAIENIIIRLIDVTFDQWLGLKFGDHR